MLALNQQAGLVIGAKLTEHDLVVALTDLGASVIARQRRPLGPGHTPERVVALVAEIVAELRAEYPSQRMLGLGLGLAGVVDRQAGICRYEPFLQWRDIPLGRMLEERLDLPAVIENNVNTLVAAEQWFGVGIGVPNFLVITLGHGIGMGMLLDGQIYRGGCGGGGEFGHITVLEDGPLCECGKRGCLEALVADPAIARRVSAALGRATSFDEAVEVARCGDPLALEVFRSAGHTLGIALAGLINIFNPPLVILSGEGARALDLLRGPLDQALEEHCLASLFADLRLVIEPLGDDTWARGAASLILEELFRPPIYRDLPARASLVIES
jgi:predicted NBD/HSP70 family sugar kinase